VFILSKMEEIACDICYLKAPSNIIITGATGSGKTCFLLKMLIDWPFKPNKGKMINFYSVWQQLFEQFIQHFPVCKACIWMKLTIVNQPMIM